MVPHQHLIAPGKRESDTEGRLYVNWIPTGDALKNVFVEEWIKVGGDSPEEQKTINAPMRIKSMAHDDETPAGQMNITQNSIEALHRRCLFRYKEDLRSCPGRRNIERRPYVSLPSLAGAFSLVYFRILKIFSEFLQPFRYIGMTLHGSHRSKSWFSFLFGLGFLVGLVNRSHRSFLSPCLLDTVTGSEFIHTGFPVLF